ncbi:SH3 domain-binding protein 5-like [Scleropages formosus]|uniref:SH3 domain-binding protein 5 n=1 Tax=Scleropages formosus TaxID=113540 RepID=A0A0P7X761_SCLFO|nr:SH3 domain-binding protein 5-like [Scleropages formosus]
MEALVTDSRSNWQVMEAEQTKTRSELVHKETAAKYNAAMNRMKQLEKKLKRAINKSKPYFEMKAKYYLQLEQLKKNVDELQARLTMAKDEYKTALRKLEMISDEIHERRRSSAIGPRGRGVGSEGDCSSTSNVGNFKVDLDGISMASETFEDETCTSATSEEDSETQSTCSLSSGPASSVDLPCPFLPSASSSSSTSTSPSRPCSLDLPSPVFLSDFGLISPVLGPRSECSGASSPECDLERGDRAEGAEAALENVLNNNGARKSVGLEGLLGRLSLKRAKTESAQNPERERLTLAQLPTPTVLLLNGV